MCTKLEDVLADLPAEATLVLLALTLYIKERGLVRDFKKWVEELDDARRKGALR